MHFGSLDFNRPDGRYESWVFSNDVRRVFVALSFSLCLSVSDFSSLLLFGIVWILPNFIRFRKSKLTSNCSDQTRIHDELPFNASMKFDPDWITFCFSIQFAKCLKRFDPTQKSFSTYFIHFRNWQEQSQFRYTFIYSRTKVASTFCYWEKFWVISSNRPKSRRISTQCVWVSFSLCMAIRGNQTSNCICTRAITQRKNDKWQIFGDDSRSYDEWLPSEPVVTIYINKSPFHGVFRA